MRDSYAAEQVTPRIEKGMAMIGDRVIGVAKDWNEKGMLKQGVVIGYVMGLIAGDGSFSGDKNPRLSIKKKNDLRLLEACRDMFGGRINGPYSHKGKDGGVRVYEVWCLDGDELEKALPTIVKYLPPCAKREQFFKWMEKYGLMDKAKGR